MTRSSSAPRHGKSWLRTLSILIFGLILAARPVAAAKRGGAEIGEDSLQTLVAQQPENPNHWMSLGILAARNGQMDLAKGYFDEAIKLAGRSGKVILQVGGALLTQGRVKASLPYLMPNLVHLDSSQLELLQAGLEREKLPSVQLIVLRHLTSRTKIFNPVNRKAAILAFRLGDYPLCHSILLKSVDQLDYESARNLLIVNFFLGSAIESKVLSTLAKKYPHGEISMLIALNHAQSGRWRDARNHLAKEEKAPSYRDYYHLVKAMAAAADDRPEEAAEEYEKALASSWDRLRVAVYADLYRVYSTTGNKFKSDQVWEALKEEYQNVDPDLQEFMARQLQARGYEKQSKYFYRVVLRKRPGNVSALTALWEDLLEKEDYEGIQESLKAVLEKDPLSCEGNSLAMNYHFRNRSDKELVPFARNATIYCFEAVEPFYVLGTTMLNMSKPEEARQYFATYIRKGGDQNRVPMSLR